MAILIESISFINYRQYGTIKLDFETSGSHLLSVLVAKNGTGKTTLLNAITWCLYGKELLTSANLEPLPLLNTTIRQNSNSGDIKTVSVAIQLIDGNRKLEFKRSQVFQIREGINLLPGKNEFSVTITDEDLFTNTRIISGADAGAVVSQYFDQDIFKYYFFDGERLQDFFSANAQSIQSIQDAIFNISQVTLLAKTCEHLKKLEGDINRAVGKQAPDIAKFNEEVEKIEQTLQDLRSSLQTLNATKKEKDDQLEKIEAAIYAQKPLQDLHKERIALETEDADLNQQLNKLGSDRCSFIQKYTILLQLYTRIKRTLSYINEKEKNGDLPPAIDREKLKNALEHPGMPCPFCNHPIDEAALAHLNELMRIIAVSSRTSNLLKEYKGSLEDCMDQIQKYKTEKQELVERAAALDSRKKEIQARLKEISAEIAGKDTDIIQAHASDLETQRRELKEAISSTAKTIGGIEQTIKQTENELKQKKVDRDSEISKAAKFSGEQEKLQVIRMLANHYEAIREKIVEQVRSEISEVTWSFFDRMIWKQNTFGSIDISPTYDVTVYDKAGHEMTGSLGATEQMALAYAFTLAIHKASGKNCPIVIDSPLGRVSDENRERMAEALLEVSQEKQIIMLFTPDEFSDNVKNVYGSYASIRTLELNVDESFIEGGEA